MALQNPKTFSNDSLCFRRSSSSLTAPPSPPPAESWRCGPHGQQVTFMDSTGWLNIASYISEASLTQAQQCALRTTTLVSRSAGPEAFDTVFLMKTRLASVYDTWYKIYVSEEWNDAQSVYGHDVPPWRRVDEDVESIARHALGDRATLIRTFRRQASSDQKSKTVEDLESVLKSKIKGGKPLFVPDRNINNRSFVLLGVRLHSTRALRGVDIGPAADSGSAAATFRAFWGDKSELRRFQDGRISEAVVWEASPSQRHTIVDTILRYILPRHIPNTIVVCTSQCMDQALQRKRGGTPDDDVAAVRLVEDAAVRLGKRLRTLDGLTLKIVGTQPLAPVLRHSDVFPPLPHLLAGAAHADMATTNDGSSRFSKTTIPRCLPVIEILCQLEGSGKWPDAPNAFAKMKASVGVQLATTLESNFGMHAAASEDYVDVLTDGFAFRLLLHTERDESMQQMMLLATGMPHAPPEEDVRLRTWHQGAVSAAAAANSAFEPSVRLAKRWIASQWLSPHFRDEAIELLVAAAFCENEKTGSSYLVAAPPPGSRVSGFLRFLLLLGDHPWTAAPLIADVAEATPSPRRRENAARAHAAQKANGTAPAMFITGPVDSECVGWTREHPTKPMLHRAAVLARKAAQKIEKVLCSGEVGLVDDDSSALFTNVFGHDQGQYEVVVRLRAESLPNKEMELPRSVLKHHSKNGNFNNDLHVYNKDYGKLERASMLAPDRDDSKHCRAVLNGIPRSVLDNRGSNTVRKELLLGFDPLPLYVSLLEERFGAVAVVCADYYGGSSVGLKLRGPALRPGPVRPEAVHASKPLQRNEDGELVVGPDLAAMAADALALGAGLVESVDYYKFDL